MKLSLKAFNCPSLSSLADPIVGLPGPGEFHQGSRSLLRSLHSAWGNPARSCHPGRGSFLLTVIQSLASEYLHSNAALGQLAWTMPGPGHKTLFQIPPGEDHVDKREARRPVPLEYGDFLGWNVCGILRGHPTRGGGGEVFSGVGADDASRGAQCAGSVPVSLTLGLCLSVLSWKW